MNRYFNNRGENKTASRLFTKEKNGRQVGIWRELQKMGLGNSEEEAKVSLR